MDQLRDDALIVAMQGKNASLAIQEQLDSLSEELNLLKNAEPTSSGTTNLTVINQSSVNAYYKVVQQDSAVSGAAPTESDFASGGANTMNWRKATLGGELSAMLVTTTGQASPSSQIYRLSLTVANSAAPAVFSYAWGMQFMSVASSTRVDAAMRVNGNLVDSALSASAAASGIYKSARNAGSFTLPAGQSTIAFYITWPQVAQTNPLQLSIQMQIIDGKTVTFVGD